jgi:hypothetical protein
VAGVGRAVDSISNVLKSQDRFETRRVAGVGQAVDSISNVLKSRMTVLMPFLSNFHVRPCKFLYFNRSTWKSIVFVLHLLACTLRGILRAEKAGSCLEAKLIRFKPVRYRTFEKSGTFSEESTRAEKAGSCLEAKLIRFKPVSEANDKKIIPNPSSICKDNACLHCQ